MKKEFLTGLAAALVLSCAPKQYERVGDSLSLEEQQPMQVPEVPKSTEGATKKYVPESTADVRTVRVPYVAQQPRAMSPLFTTPPSYKEIPVTEQKYIPIENILE